MKHFIFCLLSATLLSSCTTTTTYHPDGGKVVVKTMDDRVYFLATKGIEVIAYQYKVEPTK